MTHVVKNVRETILIKETNNPSKQFFGKPHDSTEGVSPQFQWLIVLGGTIFLLFIILKVRYSIKHQQKRKTSNT